MEKNKYLNRQISPSLPDTRVSWYNTGFNRMLFSLLSELGIGGGGNPPGFNLESSKHLKNLALPKWNDQFGIMIIIFSPGDIWFFSFLPEVLIWTPTSFKIQYKVFFNVGAELKVVFCSSGYGDTSGAKDLYFFWLHFFFFCFFEERRILRLLHWTHLTASTFKKWHKMYSACYIKAVISWFSQMLISIFLK